MTEFSLQSDIFGREAWKILREMEGFDVFNVSFEDRACSVILNGTEYRISREGRRTWHVVTTGYWWTFGSQWDLLAWIGDRL